MPGFDRTGPQGMGPMTGGGRGQCNPAFSGQRAAFGRGMANRRGGMGGGRWAGRGMRGGFGRGAGWFDPVYQGQPTAQTPDIDSLKAEAEMMKRNLEMINSRIAELEK